MANQKKYWKGLEELNESSAFVKARDKEFAKEVPIEEFLGRESITTSNTSRRDFLKYLGFTVAAASLAACESPVVKTIPYVIKPEEVTPGIDNWYASTFFNGEDYCSVLIKTRDGRPIKIEGNTNSSVTKGAANARVHASVLSLYDNFRAKTPYVRGAESTWDIADKEVGEKLAAASAKGESAKGNIVILSSTIISPSTKQIISEFTDKYPTAKHVTYDAVSFSGMRKANGGMISSYSFDKAKTIVSISADFLTNWLSPIEFSKQYAEGRKLNKAKRDMSRHIQFESIMTVSGANADMRVQIKPSEEGAVALNLYNAIAKLAGETTGSSTATPYDEQISKVAAQLWENKGKSLVVAGSNDINVQSVVNMINKTLGNYGSTINMDRECNLRQGNDEEFAALVADMKAGKVDVLITYNTNPVYTASAALGFKEAYTKVPCKVSLASSVDETANVADYICPDSHYLESWNDANPYTGQYSLAQPAISPLFCKPRHEGTRCAQETLLKWAGSDVTDYYTYIQNNWKKNLLPSVSDEGGDYLFINLWNTTLQSGVLEKANETAEKAGETTANISDIASKMTSSAKGGLEVVLYQKTSIGSGLQANNPWLQELPDPISKVTWDNYITMNPAEMKDKGFSLLEEDNHVASVATLTVNGSSIELPVFPQPGQARGTVGVALGYGRTNAGVVANGVGVNSYPWVQWTNDTFQYNVAGAEIASANKTYTIGATQTHNTMIGRPIIQEATLEEYQKNPASRNLGGELKTEEEKIKTIAGLKALKDVNLWDDFDAKSPVNLTNNAGNQGLRWKMAIDLNSCIGCGSCVVSCSAENNVPVVGKAEIVLVREMHWIRIDRYYSSDMSWEKAKEQDISESNRMYDMMVPSSDNPEIAFQPVMCQHCNHAPCETVCPVMATSHGSEGINQMVYNRCVGTKYCANNCPYKVRRFNWFNYYRDEKFLEVNPAQESNELGRMVLNPDVVVRSRGVMEKCSLCVQRIQNGKLKAKLESRPIKDGEIKPACAQSCPTEAIVFGNVNDPESKVAELIQDERNYLLLADLDTQPNVFYMTKIRNKDKAILE